MDPFIDSETARRYFRELDSEFRGPLDGLGSGDFYTQQYKNDALEPSQDNGHMLKIWNKFLPLVMGQKRPFQREGTASKSNEEALLCNQLWPCGHPNLLESWTCMPGYSQKGYQRAAHLIFGKTMPLPVSSRRYSRDSAERCVFFYNLTVIQWSL